MIDSHQHFWRYDAAEYPWIDDSMAALRRDYLPADLQREMEAAGVASCIAVQARQSLDETRALLDFAANYPFISGVVGWIDLQGDASRQLAEFAGQSSLVGVRHVVQAEPDGFLTGPAFRAGVAALEPAGLVYDILVYARQLSDAVALVRAFPRQRFVLDHLGKPDIRGNGFDAWSGQFEQLGALPNVTCKLSGLVTEADWRSWTPRQLAPYVDAALESFGPSRVMLGTDWPVCTVAASYRGVIDLVLNAIDEYSEDERRQILETTARATYSRSGAGAAGG
jgi:L-fuconolactonase